MSPGETDKRRDKRLDLTLPVKFFKGPDDGLLMRDGVTHNVSSGGVYFEAPASHVVQDGPVALRIGVHARDGEDKPSLTLVGSGVICRIEELGRPEALSEQPQATRSTARFVRWPSLLRAEPDPPLARSGGIASARRTRVILLLS